jgi:predicted PurR-regulated permease PerM
MALRSPSRDAFHLLVVVVAVVVIGALYFARVVFVPLALAMLFAFVLPPIVKLFERVRVGRTLSTFVVVLLTLAGVGAIGWIVARQFTDVLNQLPEYQSNIKEKIDSLPFSKNLTLRNASATMNQLSKALALPPEAPSGKRSANTSSRPTQPLPVEVIKPTSLPIESAQSVLGLLLQVLIVIVFTVFMLLRRENLWNRVISLAGQQRLNVMTHALDEASDRVSRYTAASLSFPEGRAQCPSEVASSRT